MLWNIHSTQVKIQNENDEVAVAIERLRQNGVNVFFTMNDIRNGSKKTESTEITDSKTGYTNSFEGNSTTTTTATTTTKRKNNKTRKGRKVPKKSKKVKSKQIKIKIDLPTPPKKIKLEVMNKVISNAAEETKFEPPLASVLQKTRAFSPDITYEINRSSNKFKRRNSGNHSIDSSVGVVSNGKSNSTVGHQLLSTNNNIEAPNCVQIETISKEIDVQVRNEHQQPKHHETVKKEAPPNAIPSEQKVKPKRKRRGTRTRLAVRKSKKSKKSSVKVKPVVTLVENHSKSKLIPENVSLSIQKIGQTEELTIDYKEEILQHSEAVALSSEFFNEVKNEISTSSSELMSENPENCTSICTKEAMSINGIAKVQLGISSKSVESSKSSSSGSGSNDRVWESGNIPVPGSEDSLPDAPDAMQLRRSSFYSLVSGNVRTNLENYLDGRINSKSPNRRRKRAKNGFLLHHGDNLWIKNHQCPEDPEAPYKLHLATQVLLKLNKRRAKFKPKEDRGKSLLSYLKLVPKRSPRNGKPNPVPPMEEPKVEEIPEPLFSGEWTLARKFVCGVCAQVEDNFWDMVMHKGEQHPGVVVTHTELAGLPPSSLVRRYPTEQLTPTVAATSMSPPPCTKCSSTFSTTPELHRHIFECAGNAAWLETDKVPRKRKPKRRRGFKRRLSNTPKKGKKTDQATAKRSQNAEVFKCEFCSKSYKNQGWLKIHLGSHSLPVSIPLEKLSLPSRASFNSLSCQLFK